MTSLINELLKFSRLFKPESQVTSTNLNEVLKNVLKDFDLMIQEKNMDIKVGRLPTIKANPLQMNQLFYNLIHNALKFSDSKEQPLIEISANRLSNKEAAKHESLDKRSNYYEIIFKDNGIGFNQEFATQIFEIFKRLNEQHIYPGSGIGLALCRKIILNHHGLIWAEGKERQGATFHVILPEDQPNEPQNV
jgi:two-component system CheB/CheR fusion protein